MPKYSIALFSSVVIPLVLATISSEAHPHGNAALGVAISDDTSAGDARHQRTQSAIKLSLDDAVALGVRRNRSIRSAHLLRVAQRFDLRVAEEIFAPKLLLTSSYIAARSSVDRRRNVEITPVVNLVGPLGTRASLSFNNTLNHANRGGAQRTGAVTFNLIQPLLRGAGNDVASAPLRLARLSEYANRLALDALVAERVQQIVVSYREVLRARETVRIAASAVDRSRELLTVNRALIRAGRMAEFDIVQTQADIASQELNLEEAENQLGAARLDLLAHLDLDLGTRIDVDDISEIKPVNIALAQQVSTALDRQPDYLLQRVSRELADIRYAVARNERLWDISLVGGATQLRDRHHSNNDRNRTRSWEAYAGVQIKIPIGDLSSQQGFVHADVGKELAKLRLGEAKLELERRVGDGVRDIHTRLRQHDIAQRALELSQRKLGIERKKLRLGRSSNFQVLSFEADLRNAEIAVLNTHLSYLQALTHLDSLTGMTLERWGIEPNV